MLTGNENQFTSISMLLSINVLNYTVQLYRLKLQWNLSEKNE